MNAQTVVMAVLAPWLACLFVSSTVLAQAPPPNDLDYDGLADDFEQVLIDRHRPRLYFDSGQSYWQMSIREFVSNSELRLDGDVYRTREQLQANLLSAFQIGVIASDGSWIQIAHEAFQPSHSDFELDLDDSKRRGLHGPTPIGTYAKVSVLDAPIYYPNRPNRPVGARGDYFIQYWQLFGFNDDCSIVVCTPPLNWPCVTFYDGDHEGDWIYLDVIVDRNTEQIREIVHHHHGSTCTVSIQPDEWPLPTDGVPTAYLEQNVNEWWPHPTVDDCTVVAGYAKCAVHDQTGIIMRTENVLNVGERRRPMPDDEAQVFILFNGDWGEYHDGPDAPVFQRWRDTYRACLFVSPVTCSSFTNLSPWCIDRFSIADVPSAASSITNTSATVASVQVYLSPGDHPTTGPLLLTSPMTLTAPNGAATIRPVP
ncbi:MAG: hypothetical protein IT438_14575 [Phycisphaerales bacterium]|nr:hypothetical protein [Phycisphaerales bacterium]